MIPPRLHSIAVTVAAGLVLLTNLGGPALWDEDEPKNAACSLAMLDRGDWIVPMFNGRLRIEKPALVNWLHIAGFAVAGRNETGARIGSACLSIGTSLLCWRIGAVTLGPTAGLLAGLAMGTCLWTAVGGRSATPDAPLVFFVSLALWCFVVGRRTTASAPAGSWRSPRHAAACGAALGAAVLAKGPAGIVLPLASFMAFVLWEAWDARYPGRRIDRLREAIAGLRLPRVVGSATLVALPWYALVTVRSGGAWLDGFLWIHNIGRFASPMEGHGGSSLAYYPLVVAVGFFPWSIVLAATAVHAAALSRSPVDSQRRSTIRLMACWFCCWVGAFSIAGTKLPGYVWPAYPALALLTADLLASWAAGEAPATARFRRPLTALDGVMGIAWSILFLVGAGVLVAMPLAASAGLPGLMALTPVGLLPAVGAMLAWRSQSGGRRDRALSILAITSCLFVACVAAVGGDIVGGARSAPRLIAAIGGRPPRGSWAGFGTVPPSVVFYAADTIPQLHSTEAVAAHLEGRPDAHLLVDARFEMNLPSPLPHGYGVIARERQLFGPTLLVIGPRPISPSPSSETPLAWNIPAPRR